MQYLIIGNGAAGTDAAIELRKNDEKADIRIVSASANPACHRPRLIDYLGKRVDFEKILIKPQDFYKEKNIRIDYNLPVEEINLKDQRLKTRREDIAWDKLLIASGAESALPPLSAGLDLANSFTFRWKEDADKIRAQAEKSEIAIVMGGGLLGLETAMAIRELGPRVLVMEYFDYLLPKQLDPGGAAQLQKLLEEKGLDFLLGARSQKLEGKEGRFNSVVLSDGNKYQADMLIFSTGIKPQTALAKNAGIKTDKGIIIDNQLQTSAANVWAAGDCAQHQGRIYGLYLPAREQGRLAADSMSGHAVDYQGSKLQTRLKVVGINLFSAGNPLAEGEAIIKEKDDFYAKLVHQEGKVLSAMVLGDKKLAVKLSAMFEGKSNFNPAVLNEY